MIRIEVRQMQRITKSSFSWFLLLLLLLGSGPVSKPAAEVEIIIVHNIVKNLGA